MIGMSVFVFLHLVRLFHFLRIGFPVLAVKSSLWHGHCARSSRENSSIVHLAWFSDVRGRSQSLRFPRKGTANDHITYYIYSPWKVKKECNMIEIILVQGFCPGWKNKINQFLIGSTVARLQHDISTTCFQTSNLIHTLTVEWNGYCQKPKHKNKKTV